MEQQPHVLENKPCFVEHKHKKQSVLEGGGGFLAKTIYFPLHPTSRVFFFCLLHQMEFCMGLYSEQDFIQVYLRCQMFFVPSTHQFSDDPSLIRKTRNPPGFLEVAGNIFKEKAFANSTTTTTIIITTTILTLKSYKVILFIGECTICL